GQGLPAVAGLVGEGRGVPRRRRGAIEQVADGLARHGPLDLGPPLEYLRRHGALRVVYSRAMTADIRLTQYASGGGCACKIPPGDLEEAVARPLPAPAQPGLLIRLEHGAAPPLALPRPRHAPPPPPPSPPPSPPPPHPT